VSLRARAGARAAGARRARTEEEEEVVEESESAVLLGEVDVLIEAHRGLGSLGDWYTMKSPVQGNGLEVPLD
jgi:hypothetical protein